MKALAFKKRRPLPLLKALSYHLTRKKDLDDIKYISDALFSLAKLNLKDPELLETLCEHGEKAFEEMGPNSTQFNAVIRSTVTSLGQLSYFHEGILKAITNFYVKMLKEGQSLDSRDLTSYLFTTAALNHIPDNSEPIYEVRK